MSAGPSKSSFPKLWPFCRSGKLEPFVVLSQTSPGEFSGSFKVSCKMIEGKLWRAVVLCLLYTGNQVRAISEKFFKEHLAEKWEDIHLTFKWLITWTGKRLEVRNTTNPPGKDKLVGSGTWSLSPQLFEGPCP